MRWQNPLIPVLAVTGGALATFPPRLLHVQPGTSCVSYTPKGMRAIPWYADGTGQIRAGQVAASIRLTGLMSNLCPATVIRVGYASVMVTVPHGQYADVTIEATDHGNPVYLPIQFVGTRTVSGVSTDEYIAAAAVQVHPTVPNPANGNPGVMFVVTRYPNTTGVANITASATGEVLPPN